MQDYIQENLLINQHTPGGNPANMDEIRKHFDENKDSFVEYDKTDIEGFNIPPEIQPMEIINNLPDAVLDDMADRIDRNDPEKSMTNIDEAYLIALAKTISSSEYRNTPSQDFLDNLNKFINNKLENEELDRFTDIMEEIYRGLALFNQKYSAIKGDSKGGLKSLLDQAGELGIDGVDKVIDTAKEMSPIMQVLTFLGLSGSSIWLLTREPSTNGEDGGSTIVTTALWLLGIGGLAFTGNLAVEALTDKSVLDHMENASFTGNDPDTLIKLMAFPGKDDDERKNAAIELSSLALFNEETESLPFKDVLDLYERTKVNGTPDAEKTLDFKRIGADPYVSKDSSPDTENQRRLAYSAIAGFSEYIKGLKVSNIDLYDQIMGAVTSKRHPASLKEVYIMATMAESRMEDYHTHFGELMSPSNSDDFNLSPDRATNFKSYLDNNDSNTNGYKEFTNWLESTYMYPKARKLGQPETQILSQEWLMETFGGHYNSMNHVPRPDLLRLALRPQNTNEEGHGKKPVLIGNEAYMAVKIEIFKDESPAEYIKRAYDVLRTTYKVLGDEISLDPMQFGIDTDTNTTGKEIALGMDPEGYAVGGTHYVLMVKLTDGNNFNPINQKS